jgi:hypothetical protein
MPKLSIAPALAGGFVLLFAAVILGGFVRGDTELVRQLASGLLNIVIAVAGFYFGSSAGSQGKDATIAQLAAAPPPPAAPDPTTSPETAKDPS